MSITNEELSDKGRFKSKRLPFMATINISPDENNLFPSLRATLVNEPVKNHYYNFKKIFIFIFPSDKARFLRFLEILNWI